MTEDAQTSGASKVEAHEEVVDDSVSPCRSLRGEFEEPAPIVHRRAAGWADHHADSMEIEDVPLSHSMSIE